MKQLVLPVRRAVDYSAASFLPTEGTRAAREALLSDFSVLGLYGPSCSGKTHLLHMWAAARGVSLGLGHAPVEAGSICVVDDVDTLDAAGQEALFHAYNALFAGGAKGQLVVASEKPIAFLGMLPDVISRLLTGLMVEVLPPTEVELRWLAVKWAFDRGFGLDAPVLDYLMPRVGRSAADVYAVMAALDVLSLEQKRRVTVPMVKQVLEHEGSEG